MQTRTCSCLIILTLIAGSVTPADGGYLTVYGGPEYSSSTRTGYAVQAAVAVNDSGTAVGNADYVANGTNVRDNAVRWNGPGGTFTELGNLGTGINLFGRSEVNDLNNDGTAVGSSPYYVNASLVGNRSVRWEASSPSAVLLSNIPPGSYGEFSTNHYATAINAGGTAVGFADRRASASGTGLGYRGVRWDGTGVAGTELGNLGTVVIGAVVGNTVSQTRDVNDAGTAVGFANYYVNDVSSGTRAVRWEAGSASATLLADLGGSTFSRKINNQGLAVGEAQKYDGQNFVGNRAVRWEGSGVAVTELEALPSYNTPSNNYQVNDVNESGTTVGYFSSSSSQGAVRWDGTGTVATLLGSLGTGSSGETNATPYAINDPGIAVGSAIKYDGGISVGLRAVAWLGDGVAIDLNTLIEPSSGWLLTSATDISNTGWILGNGTYTPTNGDQPYGRMFMLQFAVPEPRALALIVPAALFVVYTRRFRKAA